MGLIKNITHVIGMVSPLFSFKLADLTFIVLIFSALLSSCISEHGPDSVDNQVGSVQKKSIRVPLTESGQEINLSYLVAGDSVGQRVIFLHGTPGSAENWSDFLDQVPDGLEYISIDRPGFGDSEPDEAVTSFEDQVRAFVPLLVEKQGKKPIIVGHSMGGTLAVLAALRYPEKIYGIVVVGGALDPDLEEVMWFQNFGRNIDFIIPRIFANSNRELIDYENELRKFTDDMGEIKLPVVIVHGTEDSLVPYANVKFMKEKLINAAPLEIIRLEGDDHFLPWNNRASIDRAIQILTKP